MAESRAGKGYRSPINLGLPQVPQTSNDDDFQQYLMIYNAIHMLNAYLDEIRLVLEGGDPDDKPNESLRFTKSFWLPAGEDITAGMVVSIRRGKIRIGADEARAGGGALFPTPVNRFTGIALTDAAAGEQCRFGIGPAVIEVPGFKAGQLAWATLVGEMGAGGLFTERPEIEGGEDPASVVVGWCISDDMVMIIPNFFISAS